MTRRQANSQVTDMVDEVLGRSAEQWTAQGPCRAAVSGVGVARQGHGSLMRMRC
jgi:hypothetical protein